jgi:hypothetical protein
MRITPSTKAGWTDKFGVGVRWQSVRKIPALEAADGYAIAAVTIISHASSMQAIVWERWCCEAQVRKKKATGAHPVQLSTIPRGYIENSSTVKLSFLGKCVWRGV